MLTAAKQPSVIVNYRGASLPVNNAVRPRPVASSDLGLFFSGQCLPTAADVLTRFRREIGFVDVRGTGADVSLCRRRRLRLKLLVFAEVCASLPGLCSDRACEEPLELS